MDGTYCTDKNRENVAVATNNTTAARETAHGFAGARSARIADLLEHRAFAPEAVRLKIDCALEAPLLGRPAFRR